MAPGRNGFYGSFTSLATDCQHVIHYSTPSDLEIKLSRPADTYSEPPDWEDQYPPTDFVCVSADVLLCPACEEDMRNELRNAGADYNIVWADGNGDSRNETGERDIELKEAAWRYNRAAAKVANFENRMADRDHTISQAAAKLEREQKWEAGRKIKFDVKEGEGAGEKPKKRQEAKVPIVFGKKASKASDAELADAWKAFVTSQ